MGLRALGTRQLPCCHHISLRIFGTGGALDAGKSALGAFILSIGGPENLGHCCFPRCIPNKLDGEVEEPRLEPASHVVCYH